MSRYHDTENFGYSDTATGGDWQKCHFNRLSQYPMIFTKKVLFKGPKTVAVADCHCNCCHCNRSSLYHFPTLPSCFPSLKLFECAEDEGRRGDDDDEEREEGGDLRGTLIKNS